MELKNLSKASGLFDQIKSLDIEIIKIEKFAILLANKETKSEITIKVEEVNKTEGRESVLDSDGSLMNPHDDSLDAALWRMRNHFIEMSSRQRSFSCSATKSIDSNIITQKLSDTVTLELLGLLLGEKQRQRKLIIAELNKIGIK